MMDNHELIKKVVGPIRPIGESNTDAQRFENLKEMCHLVEMLLMDISDMEYSNRDDKQGSVRKCADYAAMFIGVTVKDLLFPSDHPTGAGTEGEDEKTKTNNS